MGIDINGRVARTITSEAGLKTYYEHLNHWRVCYGNTNPLVVPTQAEALEYLKLQEEKNTFFFCNDQDSRRKQRQLAANDTKYDWRPRKSGQETSVGIISPAGEQLLPSSFAEVFTQFDSINDKPEFIPVSDGQAWGLVSSTTPPVLMTDFKYIRGEKRCVSGRDERGLGDWFGGQGVGRGLVVGGGKTKRFTGVKRSWQTVCT